MDKNKDNNKIYIGTLYRFGYDLTCVDNTEKRVVDALMKEYDRAYRQSNDGLDPRKQYSGRSKKSDYAVAKSEIGICETTLGEVEWQ